MLSPTARGWRLGECPLRERSKRGDTAQNTTPPSVLALNATVFTEYLRVIVEVGMRGVEYIEAGADGVNTSNLARTPI